MRKNKNTEWISRLSFLFKKSKVECQYDLIWCDLKYIVFCLVPLLCLTQTSCSNSIVPNKNKTNRRKNHLVFVRERVSRFQVQFQILNWSDWILSVHQWIGVCMCVVNRMSKTHARWVHTPYIAYGLQSVIFKSPPKSKTKKQSSSGCYYLFVCLLIFCAPLAFITTSKFIWNSSNDIALSINIHTEHGSFSRFTVFYIFVLMCLVFLLLLYRSLFEIFQYI